MNLLKLIKHIINYIIMNYFTHLNYFNKNKKSQNGVLSKTVIKQNQTKYLDIINDIFINNKLTISNKFLNDLLTLINSRKTGTSKGVDTNSALSSYLMLIIQIITNNLDKISQQSIESNFKIFLNNLVQIIVVSLLQKDINLLKVIIRNMGISDTVDETIIHDMSIHLLNTSIDYNSIIKILKELLHHQQICMSNNSYVPYILETSMLTEILESSKTSLKNRTKYKFSSKEFITISDEIKVNIENLFSNYNSLIALVFDANAKIMYMCNSWLITLFYTNRGIYKKSVLDKEIVLEILKTIEGGGLKNIEEQLVLDMIPDVDKIVNKITKGLTFKPFLINNFAESKYVHISSSSGPNGRPALLFLPLDALAISRNKELFKAIILLGDKFGIKNIDTTINDCVSKMDEETIKNYTENLDKSKIVKDSKLEVFEEVGGKWRVVAIVDIFSQTVLNPVHEVFSTISEHLVNTSAHYDQDSAFMRLYDISLNTRFLGTIDLTSATDLLYLKLLQKVVDTIFLKTHGLKGVGQMWADVISNKRDFIVNKFEDLGLFKYKIGQPMGAKSSWVVMHITLIVLAMQAEINVSNKGHNIEYDQFSICGDDSEFCNELVYHEYKNILNKLKIKINESKSFFTNQPSQNTILFGEYLKRFVYIDQVFRPISPRLGTKFIQNPKQQLFSFIKSLLINGLTFNGFDLIVFALNMSSYNHNGELEYQDDSRQEWFEKAIEQIYFWLLLHPDYRGLNIPTKWFFDCFDDSFKIFKAFSLAYPTLEPGMYVKGYIIISQIKSLQIKAKLRSEGSIKSVFTKTGMLFINNIVTENVTKEKNIPIDWDKVMENITDNVNKDNLQKYPIFKLLMNIIIHQRSKLIKDLEEMNILIDKVRKTGLVADYTQSEIDTLLNYLNKTKKMLIIQDIYSAIIPDNKDEDIVDSIPINSNLIKQIKNFSILKMKRDQIKYAKHLASNLFK